MTLRAQKSECPHCAADTGDLTGKTLFHCDYCGRAFPVKEVADQLPEPDAVLDAQLQLQLRKMELDANLQKQEVIIHAPIQVKDPFIESPYREVLFGTCNSIEEICHNYHHGGCLGRTLMMNGDKTTTYRLLRPRDLVHGGAPPSYTSRFKAGNWSRLFGMEADYCVLYGQTILFVGWFCNVDLGGGVLRLTINGVERNLTPAAFVYPVRQYLTPSETFWAQPNDIVQLDVFNPTPKDIEGVIMPVAAIIGPAAQLGLEPYTQR